MFSILYLQCSFSAVRFYIYCILFPFSAYVVNRCVILDCCRFRGSYSVAQM